MAGASTWWTDRFTATDGVRLLLAASPPRVYERVAGVWTEVATLVPTQPYIGSFFNKDLCIDATDPARLAATRLPDKPLAEIAGEPMIVHVWRRAMEHNRTFTADDLDELEVHLREQVKGLMAEAKLPQEVRRQGVTVEKGSSAFLQVLAFFSDDGSRDDTWSYLARAASHYPGLVKPVRFDRNLRPAAPR